jgi:hypothetical protein
MIERTPSAVALRGHRRDIREAGRCDAGGLCARDDARLTWKAASPEPCELRVPNAATRSKRLRSPDVIRLWRCRSDCQGSLLTSEAVHRGAAASSVPRRRVVHGSMFCHLVRQTHAEDPTTAFRFCNDVFNLCSTNLAQAHEKRPLVRPGSVVIKEDAVVPFSWTFCKGNAIRFPNPPWGIVPSGRSVNPSRCPASAHRLCRRDPSRRASAAGTTLEENRYERPVRSAIVPATGRSRWRHALDSRSVLRQPALSKSTDRKKQFSSCRSG